MVTQAKLMAMFLASLCFWSFSSRVSVRYWLPIPADEVPSLDSESKSLFTCCQIFSAQASFHEDDMAKRQIYHTPSEPKSLCAWPWRAVLLPKLRIGWKQTTAAINSASNRIPPRIHTPKNSHEHCTVLAGQWKETTLSLPVALQRQLPGFPYEMLPLARRCKSPPGGMAASACGKGIV